jgi:hypothetical protein
MQAGIWQRWDISAAAATRLIIVISCPLLLGHHQKTIIPAAVGGNGTSNTYVAKMIRGDAK